MVNFKKLVANSRYRAQRRTGDAGDLTVSELKRHFFLSGNCCEWCGKSLQDKNTQIDHIIPLVMYGRNTIDNIAFACKKCNESKQAMHPAKFAALQQRKGIETQLVTYQLRHYELIVGVQLQLQLFYYADEKAA
jgi:5-methylcytosine-specific restriction endonuclease McrA